MGTCNECGFLTTIKFARNQGIKYQCFKADKQIKPENLKKENDCAKFEEWKKKDAVQK